MTSTHLIDVPGGQLSARISRPAGRPRGLVVALHGGTYDSAYYDTGVGSLLSEGTERGLCVAAIDRPGYGAAANLDPKWFGFSAQAELVASAVHQVIADIEPVHGTVLVGHSIGAMIALHVAAGGSAELQGVELSGIGARWRPGMVEMWSSFIGEQPAITVPAQAHAQVMFGPAGTHDAVQIALDAQLLRPMPMPELVDVVRWTDTFADVAAGVTAPVSLTFPEHDNIWMTDADARTLAASLFTRSPSVRAELFEGAGHCTELHLGGPQYCFQQIAFVDACLVPKAADQHGGVG